MKSYFKNSSGLYFVKGQGFTAKTQATASQLTAGEVDCARGLGYVGTTEAVPVRKSWGVCYVRATDLNGTAVKPNKRNPSERRFATKQEAVTHGSRFNVRRKRKGDSAGTANHVGFYVVETNDPVNAAINPQTGLTNSI